MTISIRTELGVVEPNPRGRRSTRERGLVESHMAAVPELRPRERDRAAWVEYRLSKADLASRELCGVEVHNAIAELRAIERDLAVHMEGRSGEGHFRSRETRLVEPQPAL